MRRVKIPAGLKRAYRAALAAHWTVSFTRNGHLKWTSPAGAVVFTPGTPSEYHSDKNSVALLRRNGLEV